MENLYQDVANIPFEQVIDRYLNEVTSQKSRSRVFRNNHIIIDYFYRYFLFNLTILLFKRLFIKESLFSQTFYLSH